jgi:HK97 family phage major capsid protein
MKSRALLEKADLSLSDLQTDGGYLVAEQAKKFMEILINESRLLKMITFRPMNSPKMRIEGFRFGDWVLQPGVSGQALTVGDRVKPDMHKVELDAQLFRAEVRLSDEVLEDQIERGQFKNSVMNALAKALSRDVERVVILGDTASATPVLAVLDGIIKQATTNVVTVSPIAAIAKQHLTDAIKTMPSEFIVNKKSMRFFTSVDAETDWRNLLAERATTVGDKFLEQDAPTLVSGVPLVDIPLFPENLGGGTNETVILLCDPKNIHVGMLRNIRIVTKDHPESGEIGIYASTRFDVKYAYEPAVVKVEGIKVSA